MVVLREGEKQGRKGRQGGREERRERKDRKEVFIYYKELVHMIMEPEKSHSLQAGDPGELIL